MEDKFKGMSFDFQIVEGKIGLDSGHKKAQDNFLMFFGYSGWFRPYFQDYCSPLYELIQRRGTEFETLKTLIFGRMRRAIIKYMPYVRVFNISFTKDPQDLKTRLITMTYAFDVRENEDEGSRLFTATLIN